MTNNMKHIRNWPGYFITREGQVFSTRNSRDGSYRPKKTRSDGTVLLTGPNGERSLRVSKLVSDAWGSN